MKIVKINAMFLLNVFFPFICKKNLLNICIALAEDFVCLYLPM